MGSQNNLSTYQKAGLYTLIILFIHSQIIDCKGTDFETKTKKADVTELKTSSRSKSKGHFYMEGIRSQA